MDATCGSVITRSYDPQNRLIAGVAVQGENGQENWVSGINIGYFLNGETRADVKGVDEAAKIFEIPSYIGGRDATNHHRIFFNEPVEARYIVISIAPLAFQGNRPALRVGLILVECDIGFHVENDECTENQCQCPGGVASVGADCPEEQSFHCSSCDAGHYLDAPLCELNFCTCENGVGAVGEECTGLIGQTLVCFCQIL